MHQLMSSIHLGDTFNWSGLFFSFKSDLLLSWRGDILECVSVLKLESNLISLVVIHRENELLVSGVIAHFPLSTVDGKPLH